MLGHPAEVTVPVFISHRVAILRPDLSPVAYVGHQNQDQWISLDFFLTWDGRLGPCSENHRGGKKRRPTFLSPVDSGGEWRSSCGEKAVR